MLPVLLLLCGVVGCALSLHKRLSRTVSFRATAATLQRPSSPAAALCMHALLLLPAVAAAAAAVAVAAEDEGGADVRSFMAFAR